MKIENLISRMPKKLSISFYFLIQQNNDKKEVFRLFSKRFFQEVEKERFEQILNKTDSDFGKVKDYELTNSWTQIIEGSNPISKYELSYLVTRDSTQTKEYFRLQKEKDSIKIISYRLDFDIIPKNKAVKIPLYFSQSLYLWLIILFFMDTKNQLAFLLHNSVTNFYFIFV
ncbi:hypothetical protein [Chryseobacterium cheonjiense]|uniref:Uncharacterized protein n=1 Tax=Chryseobacterium cheonjiense TaxID=2728845 RepID=A0A7Y0A9Y5_9FLAO|nr:hypothetical protein [Chryseobacterium cheonjiense]NML59417.1 hypothetical protein [Chryseobacterium cheonjiense]